MPQLSTSLRHLWPNPTPPAVLPRVACWLSLTWEEASFFVGEYTNYQLTKLADQRVGNLFNRPPFEKSLNRTNEVGVVGRGVQQLQAFHLVNFPQVQLRSMVWVFQCIRGEDNQPGRWPGGVVGPLPSIGAPRSAPSAVPRISTVLVPEGSP